MERTGPLTPGQLHQTLWTSRHPRGLEAPDFADGSQGMLANAACLTRKKASPSASDILRLIKPFQRGAERDADVLTGQGDN